MTDATTETKVYESYDKFLQAALARYYEKGGKGRRVNFLALLLASGETWKVALQRVKSISLTSKVVGGVASAVAIRMLLRYALAGPLGIVITAASAASLVSLYLKNQDAISAKVKGYREHIHDYEGKFEKIRGDWVDGKISDDQRDLMLDGLLQRFLADLEE
ncbi:MAG: hypothetical protein HYY06_30090 [Deltaproteobacteria bacterium]|nr:hypothetical protein [Deltaproteobacteria bacterium]